MYGVISETGWRVRLIRLMASEHFCFVTRTSVLSISMDGLLPERSGFGFGQSLKKSNTNHLLSTTGTFSLTHLQTTVFMHELGQGLPDFNWVLSWQSDHWICPTSLSIKFMILNGCLEVHLGFRTG
jgi:hypothetical protein